MWEKHHEWLFKDATDTKVTINNNNEWNQTIIDRGQERRRTIEDVSKVTDIVIYY